jgi:hypothetical protein
MERMGENDEPGVTRRGEHRQGAARVTQDANGQGNEKDNATKDEKHIDG